MTISIKQALENVRKEILVLQEVEAALSRLEGPKRGRPKGSKNKAQTTTRFHTRYVGPRTKQARSQRTQRGWTKQRKRKQAKAMKAYWTRVKKSALEGK